jgi:hypothetical protein
VTRPVTGPIGIPPAQPRYPTTSQQPDLWNAGVTITLNAGTNTIEFSNPTAYAPDIDHIVV